MDETGVFADPANACTLGKVTFEYGAGVGIPAVFYRTSNLLLDKLDEFLHAGGEDIMIVRAPGVGGDLRPHP